ncbi:MAG: FeoB-associated Cys-rich membrane protein [Desulfuromonadales bacterium]|nr:FeoB-associated Cys-rich membrane protein [Desulfuromonadales bacterium]NIR33806.1 FeoB-associated Cys-rich membrane protein [Desulfuromonadales bacterium]NIS42509.1 FeoB-associated Cys-rich membrane protein [Desulfuromonadales bacterium]
MGTWDAVITFGIIAAAAAYIVRKFAKAKKSGGGCGCGSESSCCGSAGDSSNCGGHHH